MRPTIIVSFALIMFFGGMNGCDSNGQNENNGIAPVKDMSADTSNIRKKDVDDPSVPNVVLDEGNTLSVIPSDFNDSGKLDVEIHLDTKNKLLGAMNFFFDFDSSKVLIDETRGLDITKDSGKGFHYSVATSNYTLMSNSSENTNGHFRLAAIAAFANNADYAIGNSVHVVTIHLQKQPTFNSGDVSIRFRINEKSDDLGKTIP